MKDNKDVQTPPEENGVLEEEIETRADIPEPEAKEAEAQESDPLGELQKKYDALNDRYLRAAAEFDNYRKRTQREKDELYGNATAATLEKLLPTLDNFQRAVAYDPDSEDFKKGFELIYTGFQSVLESFGLTAFGEVGETFDPNLHSAVSHIEDDSLGENVISQVLQKGYRMGERVIRYAMVQTAN